MLIENDKKLDKKYYAVLVGLVILNIICYYYFAFKIIGHNIKFNIFIYWIPIVVGIILVGLYRKKILVEKYATIRKDVFSLTITSFFYLSEGLIVSYLTFGLISNIAWKILNETSAKHSKTETFSCDITRFWEGRKSSSVDFKFQDNYESIKVDYKIIENYLDKKPENYKLIIEGQKGIWNFYKLNSWTIAEK